MTGSQESGVRSQNDGNGTSLEHGSGGLSTANRGARSVSLLFF